MVEIYLNSKNRDLTFEAFIENFMAICLEHKEQNRALIFAFILYDFNNPHISKLLRDDDYWRNLDELSGNLLTVFSFHYENAVRLKKRPGNNSRIVNRMVDIDTTINPAIATQNILNHYFGDVDVVFPAIMFFQVGGNEIIDYSIMQLRETTIEASFIELKKYIQSAIKALSKVTEENKDNNMEIFELVDLEVKGYKAKEQAVKYIKKIPLVSLFKFFFKGA